MLLIVDSVVKVYRLLQMNDKYVQLLGMMYDCAAKKDAHYHCSIFYHRLDKLIGLPQVIISSILSTSTFSQASSDINSSGLTWFIASSSLTLTVLTAVSRFCDFGSRKDVHKRISVFYGKLERHIKVHISDNSETNAKLYIHCTEEYNKIREDAPLLSNLYKEHTYEECLKKVVQREKNLKEIIVNEISQNTL